MPVLFRARGYRFFFYSSEGSPIEPAHVHVEKDGIEAKFQITPEVRVAYNDGFNARTLREPMGLTEASRARIERAWNDHFGQGNGGAV